MGFNFIRIFSPNNETRRWIAVQRIAMKGNAYTGKWSKWKKIITTLVVCVCGLDRPYLFFFSRAWAPSSVYIRSIYATLRINRFLSAIARSRATEQEIQSFNLYFPWIRLVRFFFVRRAVFLSGCLIQKKIPHRFHVYFYSLWILSFYIHIALIFPRSFEIDLWISLAHIHTRAQSNVINFE